MSKDYRIELWNISDSTISHVGAQDIFNIIGNINCYDLVKTFCYSLNGNETKPITFKKNGTEGNRLEKYGDFNIDTIDSCELNKINEIILKAELFDGKKIVRTANFEINNNVRYNKCFSLNLTDIKHTQEVAQIVDGKWEINKGTNNEPRLGIKVENAGLDRIILFGNRQNKNGYIIKAVLEVDKILANSHSVGLVFDWKDHAQGNGHILPSTWTTGLGYYYSKCRGIRLRYGLNVHKDENGKKIGDHILKTEILSFWRYILGIAIKKITKSNIQISQLKTKRKYQFILKKYDKNIQLIVSQYNSNKKPAEINVINPPCSFESGSVGVIAHRCAVNIYDFSISNL